MKYSIVVLASLILLLTGCSGVGPKYSGPPKIQLQDQFTNPNANSGKSSSLDQWWKELRDPQLNRFIELGLKNNLDLKMATEKIKIAHARKRSIRANYLPQIAANSSFTRTRNSENLEFPFLPGGSGGFIPAEFDQWALESQVGWELDLFGGGRKEMESFQSQYVRDQALHDGVKLAIITEITESYFSIAGLTSQLAALRENVQIQSKTLQMVEDRLQVGSGSRLDVSRAKTRLLSTRSQIPVIESAVFAETRAFTILLGLAPGELDEEFESWVSLPNILPMVEAGLPSDLIQRRPDIRAAEQSLISSNAEIGKAVSSFYPKFYLLGKPQLLSSSAVNLLDSDSFAWQLAPRIEWQIFTSGRNKAVLEGAKSNYQVDLLAYEKLVKQAFAEVESSIRQLDAEKRQYNATDEALKELKESVDLVRMQYQTGTSSLLDYLVEQQRYTELNQTHKTRKLSMILSWVRLHKALGGGWNA